VVIIGAGVAVVVVVVGAAKVVRVGSVLVAPEVVVLSGGGVELITAVVLPVVGLLAVLVVVTELPLRVELVPV
jgi:hypothetical protein